jgi:hypothetical protein
VSQPGRDDGGAPAPGEPLDEFLEGLHNRFANYRPQGSAAWNFAAAFRHLEAEWGSAARQRAEEAELGDGTAASPTTPAPTTSPKASVRRVADRMAVDRMREWVDLRVAAAASAAAEQAVTESVARAASRVATGFDATLEALRFLAARVEALEAAAGTRHDPVPGMAWLAPDEPVGVDELLRGPVAAALSAELSAALSAESSVDALAEPSGELRHRAVLHAECGTGALLEALEAAGVPARGVDPRGALALEAARRGLHVETGEPAAALAGMEPNQLGALVLSGVVDRAPIEDLCALLDLARRALAAGAPLMIVSSGPAAVDGWAAVARDLIPGRPLHHETWELLLGRAGFTDVRRYTGAEGIPGGSAGGAYAVMARAPQ